MPLMRSLTWMQIYRMNELLNHGPMIMIVSGYNLDRNSSMENPEQREGVPTYLCENPSPHSSKESVPGLRDFVVILEVIAFCDPLSRTCSLMYHVLLLGINSV